MKKSSVITEVLFTFTIVGILIFLELPYVPVIFSAGLILVYSTLNNGIGKELGFIKPAKLFKTIGLSLILSVGMFVSSYFIFLPTIEFTTGVALRLGPFAQLRGNTTLLFTSIAIGWISGAFMEEIIFRGFLLSRITKLLPGKLGAIAGIVVTSVLFGYLHEYQGITGQLLIGFMGTILGVIYLLNQGKIWLNILTHGFVNTITMVLLYAGII